MYGKPLRPGAGSGAARCRFDQVCQPGTASWSQRPECGVGGVTRLGLRPRPGVQVLRQCTVDTTLGVLGGDDGQTCGILPSKRAPRAFIHAPSTRTRSHDTHTVMQLVLEVPDRYLAFSVPTHTHASRQPFAHTQVRLVLEFCDKGSLKDALDQHAFMSGGLSTQRLQPAAP